MTRARANALALEHHLALAALRHGAGAMDQAGLLLRTALIGYFISKEERDSHQEDIFFDARETLTDVFDRAEADGDWAISDSEYRVLCAATSLHDAQLMRVPTHIYDKSCLRTQNFLFDSLIALNAINQTF